MAVVPLALLAACDRRAPLPKADLLELEFGGTHPRVTDGQLRLALQGVAGPDPSGAVELPFPGEGEVDPGPPSANLGTAAEAVATGADRAGRAADARQVGARRALGSDGAAGAPGGVEPRAPEPPALESAGPGTSPPPGEPEPTPQAPVSVREVELLEGETLYRIALRELNDGSRWREIAALNGWSEAQARSLPVGTRVRLPRE